MAAACPLWVPQPGKAQAAGGETLRGVWSAISNQQSASESKPRPGARTTPLSAAPARQLASRCASNGKGVLSRCSNVLDRPGLLYHTSFLPLFWRGELMLEVAHSCNCGRQGLERAPGDKVRPGHSAVDAEETAPATSDKPRQCTTERVPLSARIDGARWHLKL
ncbi:hypothetical protein F5884DRAFT_91653 [Xylogone sp. PMI_703]|nr:hypothetical protein F5884DRAFT_91653 [Xylogone sp. PMI_703]